MSLIADTLYKCSHFGDAATPDMVRKELADYSDYDIHQLCCTYTRQLGHLGLQQEDLFTSAKMQCLKQLLPDLRAKGHR
eukprot:15045-Heterococcus_DN1.PRE.2